MHERRRGARGPTWKILLRIVLYLLLIAVAVVAVILFLVWMEEGEAEPFPSKVNRVETQAGAGPTAPHKGQQGETPPSFAPLIDEDPVEGLRH